MGLKSLFLGDIGRKIFDWGKGREVSSKLNSTKKSASKNAKGENKISLHYYFDFYEKTF